MAVEGLEGWRLNVGRRKCRNVGTWEDWKDGRLGHGE
jgi:hypothetical protein